MISAAVHFSWVVPLTNLTISFTAWFRKTQKQPLGKAKSILRKASSIYQAVTDCQAFIPFPDLPLNQQKQSYATLCIMLNVMQSFLI